MAHPQSHKTYTTQEYTNINFVTGKCVEMREKPDKSVRQPTMVTEYQTKECSKMCTRGWWKLATCFWQDENEVATRWMIRRESRSQRKNSRNGSGEPSYQHPWYCTSNWSLEKWSLACALEWRITSSPSFEGSASTVRRL